MSRKQFFSTSVKPIRLSFLLFISVSFFFSPYLKAQPIPSSSAGGGYIAFDGTDQYLYLPVDENFHQVFEEGITIEGWFRFNHFLTEGEIWLLFSKLSSYLLLFRGSGEVKEFLLWPCGEDNNFIFNRDCAIVRKGEMGFQYLVKTQTSEFGGFKLIRDFDIQPWHHFALTVSKKRNAVYIDGKAWHFGHGNVDNLPLKRESNPFYLGGRPDYPSLDGQLDEIRISNISRYEGPGFLPPRRFRVDSHTIALYHFDKSNPLADTSGNNNHLRAHGFPQFREFSVHLGRKLRTTWATVKKGL